MKTTVAISKDLMTSFHQIIGQKENIEKLIEQLLQKYLEDEKKKRKDLKDLQILNENSDFLNSEAQDVLTYQVSL